MQIYVSVQVTATTADLTRLYIFLAGNAMQSLATSLQAAGECTKQLEACGCKCPACYWRAGLSLGSLVCARTPCIQWRAVAQLRGTELLHMTGALHLA